MSKYRLKNTSRRYIRVPVYMEGELTTCRLPAGEEVILESVELTNQVQTLQVEGSIEYELIPEKELEVEKESEEDQETKSPKRRSVSRKDQEQDIKKEGNIN